MRIQTKGLRITCHHGGRVTIELAGGRLFDADLVHVRALDGAVISSPVTCDLFALPKTVNLMPLENAELFRLPTVAKKLRRRSVELETFANRHRIGKRYGPEKLLTAAEIERLKTRLAEKK